MQQLYENKKLKIDDLYGVKMQLKKKINVQREEVFIAAKRLVPFTKDSTTISLSNKLLPLSLITFPFRKGKVFSVVEGVLMGFRLMKNIRRLMRK